MSNHVKAGILVTLLIICIRIAAAFHANWVMVLPMFVVFITVTRFSPPITVLSMLYGWVLFGDVTFPRTWTGFHIPVLSILTIWVILLLIYQRYIDGTLRCLLRWVVCTYLLLIMGFFVIGFMVSLYYGMLSNPYVKYFIWDIFRGWMGYLVLGMLGCRNLNDFKVLLICFPILFLIYPLSLPVSSWQNLFVHGIHSSSVFSIGLGYGSLNTNVLGQAASLAGVVAAGNLSIKKSRLFFGIMLFLFAACSLIAFLTASRQAILSLVAGLCMIGLVSGFRRGVIVLISIGFLVYFGGHAIISLLPDDSGFQSRFLELTEPVNTWKSQSFTLRYKDITESMEKWWESPFIGKGFGGQNYEALESLNEYNDFLLRGTHNLFTGILVQTGILGTGLIMLFVIGILRRFLSFVKCVPPHWSMIARHSRIVITGSMFCIFVQQNISGGFGTGSTAMIFLLGALLGVIGAGTKQFSYVE